MEGKETRFGVAGGVGSGLYGMLIMSIIAVFIAGLMVGRTPEYLGKKIGVRQIALAACYLLVTPALVLGLTAAAMPLPTPGDSMTNAGPHGFSEILYAYTSAANNNGSAFPRTPPQAPRTAHRPAEERVGAGVFDPGLPVRHRATASAPRTSPPDAVTSSGSGLDPHISPAYAELQVHRVAQRNHLDAERVADHTEGRTLGFAGEPRVNVLKLNIALKELVDAG